MKKRNFSFELVKGFLEWFESELKCRMQVSQPTFINTQVGMKNSDCLNLDSFYFRLRIPNSFAYFVRWLD